MPEIVTTEWKTNQEKTLIPEAYLQLYYELSDVDALMDASVSDNGSEFYSDTSQVVSEVVTSIIPYTTLEHNFFILDGSRQILTGTETYQNSGYVGNALSDENCIYEFELPVETPYTQLEYIESSGTQYIDTGFKPNNNTRAVVDFEFTKTTTNYQGVIASRTSASGSDRFCFWLAPNNVFRSDLASGNISFEAKNQVVGVRFVLDKNKNVCTMSDGTSVTNTSGTFTSSYSLYLFGGNTKGTVGEYANMKLYSCQIYDNDVLVRDYVPCLYEGEIGLWDKVEKKFYGNSGTGSFTAGNKIEANQVETGVPTLTIDFTKVHTYRIPGINITWGSNFSEYAKHFKVIVYNGDTVKNEIEVTDNESCSIFIESEIYDYDRIEVEIYEWSLPGRRARVESIVMGVKVEYTKNDILSFSQSMSVDPISAALPVNTIEFSLNNLDGKFDLQNISGIGKYLIERQAIKVTYGFKKSNGEFEKINGGIYYMNEWEAPQKGLKANFKARDLLDFMEKTYIKGIYHPSGITLYDLAQEVLEDLDALLNEDGTVKWSLDESLKNISTKAPLPIVTIAECLQYIAQASCCVMYCDRKGVFHIEPINNDSTDYNINFFKSYDYPTYTLQKPLKDISINVYNFTPSAETTELFNGTMNISGTKTVTLTYSGKAYNCAASVTNGTLDSAVYYGNACELTITASGDVTIVVNGNAIDESYSEWIVENDVKGETQTVCNPLITSREHAETVGQWVKEWLVKRNQYAVSFRLDPRLDPMDIVNIEDSYGNNQARNVSHKFTYTGGQFKGESEGRIL